MSVNVILNNGVKMHIIGFGLWALYSNECIQCVKDAISVGYRHFDTAQVYRNEREVGEGIRQSKFPRDQLPIYYNYFFNIILFYYYNLFKGFITLFVTTKTGTNGYSATKRGIEESLKRFGFPYFDLILVHWPQSDNIGTYRAIEEAYKEGKCRAIGLSNFNQREFLEIYNIFQTKPTVNQIETHLHFKQKKMHNFLLKYNCIHESWSPFGGPGGKLLNDQTLKSVASKNHKTPAQILLRYLLHLGIVIIPKTAKKSRMIENLNIFNFSLSDADIKILASLDTGKGGSWPYSMHEEFY